MFFDDRSRGELHESHRLERAVERGEEFLKVRASRQKRSIDEFLAGRIRVNHHDRMLGRRGGAQGNDGPTSGVVLSYEMIEPLVRLESREIELHRGRIELQG